MQAEELDRAVRERYDGPFISADDLEDGKTFVVKIAAVAAPNTEKDAQKRLIDKAILTFEKAKKRLILNSTNEKLIRRQLGTKASKWVGQSITLMRRYCEAFGETVPCVRVALPPGQKCPRHLLRGYGTAGNETGDG